MRPAYRLVRLLVSVKDPSMAARYARHEFTQLGPDAAGALISEIAAAAEAGDVDAAFAMLVIGSALAREAGTRSHIANSLRERGDAETAGRLHVPGRAEAATEERVPDFGKGRPLSLGERKSLARTRERGVLARVLADPHPDVVRVLLANPALTERDVIRLCAKRPIGAAVLREVASSARWIVRYGVRLALVKNPHTPEDLALLMVAHLRSQDAREVSRSPELPLVVRQASLRLLSPRVLH